MWVLLTIQLNKEKKTTTKQPKTNKQTKKQKQKQKQTKQIMFF